MPPSLNIHNLTSVVEVNIFPVLALVAVYSTNAHVPIMGLRTSLLQPANSRIAQTIVRVFFIEQTYFIDSTIITLYQPNTLFTLTRKGG